MSDFCFSITILHGIQWLGMCRWFLSRPGRGSCPWHLFGGAVLAFTKPSSLALVKNTTFTFAKLYSKLSKTHLIHKTILWHRGYLPRVIMRTLRLREGVVTFPGADSRLVICSLLYYRCLVQSWRILKDLLIEKLVHFQDWTQVFKLFAQCSFL